MLIVCQVKNEEINFRGREKHSRSLRTHVSSLEEQCGRSQCQEDRQRRRRPLRGHPHHLHSRVEGGGTNRYGQGKLLAAQEVKPWGESKQQSKSEKVYISIWAQKSHLLPACAHQG